MHPRSDVSPLVLKDRWTAALERPAEKPPSMRVFGLVMLLGFGVLGGLLLWGWYRTQSSNDPGGLWRLVIGAALVSVGALIFLWSLVAPRSLPPVYRAWMTFGQWLGTLVSTLLLSAAYLVVVAPVGLLMRATGTDPLERRIDRRAPSYWRNHVGPRPPADYTHMS